MENHHHTFKKKPNFLFFIVDQERYPTVYENAELTKWRAENLLAQELLRENGFEFTNQYVGSTACSPSRTTLYTGQYPSLHGVTQTTGVAKDAFDPDVFWLDPNTVPTMGDYFRASGYRTYWKGKWHASDEDILIPGTKNALPSYSSTGVPDKEQVQKYLQSNRLDSFGFSGWIGPEPHGKDPRNSGSSAAIGVDGRDVIYSEEVVRLIQSLDQENRTTEIPPWVIVSSFVNPHDIALFGLRTEASPLFNFEIDPTVPFIPPAPTANESLLTKPIAQESYRITYPKALQPLIDTPFYRRLYYSLQKKADNAMLKVFNTLKNSSFYEDTIVFFLADHGELLGAHGGLFQKWYNAYEESIHVPFIIHNPKLFSGRQKTEMLTSHVDVLPTMLGLAGINVAEVQKSLSSNHTEVHPLVGRDLTPLLLGKNEFFRANEPLYFMSDDNVTQGPNQVSATGEPYEAVIQPNHLETIITTLPTGPDKRKEIWKLTRYFDNPQFWSEPGCSNQVVAQNCEMAVAENTKYTTSITYTNVCPVPDQYELYNLTTDPLEQKNLANPAFQTIESRRIQPILILALQEQCNQKRLAPTSGNVPGMPPCDCE